MFEEGSFVPTARITDRGSQSIVTDYLGTPTQMYDAEGNKTWEAQVDIYGRVRTFAGRSLSECPFRYQGQYEDSETGLYYNRFRYYDPSIGNYISKDPIGLAGGYKLYNYVNNTNNLTDIFGWHATQISHGSTDLSQMVQQYRIDHPEIGIGRNVAAFEYLDDNGNWAYEIAESRGQHSERIIGDKLSDMDVESWRVSRIYSDLEPCCIPGGQCKDYIARNYPDADVTYSFEYGDTFESRKKGVNDMKKANRALHQH